ncbi:TonB-dependent receptor [Sphingomonas sp.]|uniref:TonB-dependent receptor n=1 Tax=Sphingomonas sp. TaxID=28214 RepID=UPI001ECE2AC6|nr:TonB-dependent receptor [Sphingomonas sp.]MBX3594710.1 TonB-dependent receptor [Sphingomonas sp.]
MRKFHLYAALPVIALMPAQAFAKADEAPSTTAAQGVDGQDATDPAQSGEIVVTAQRREERLIDVPLSVSAVSPAELDRAQVRTVTDIATVVPNLQINETIGNTFGPLITIRGLSPSADTSLARDQPVGLYLDGVPIGKSTGAAFDTIDLQRVEVLRGPQGTLYGKNTIGGAVNLITQEPTGEFGGQVSANVGSYGLFNAKAVVDLPEVAGFSLKLSGTTKQLKGYYRNSFNNTHFGEADTWSGRVDLMWRPVDSLSVRYAYDITDSHGTPSQLATTAVTGSGSTAFINAMLAPYVVTGRTRTIAAQSALQSDFRTTGHAVTVQWEPGVGDMVLKSITAWRTAKTFSQSDFDGSPLDLFRFTLNNDYRQFTQELQAIGSVGDLRYTLGAFYLDDAYDVFNPRWNFQFGGNSTFDVSQRGGNSNSYAGYGQLAWSPSALDNRLTVSVGARYTKEEKSAYELLLANTAYRTNPASASSGVFRRDAAGNPITRSGQPAAGARPGAGGIGYTDLYPLTASGDWSSFNPELNILYKFAPTFSVYGRVASGFKSGGINDTAATNDAFATPYNPEKLTSFELGFKYASADRRIRLDVAAYHSIYKDFQAGVFVPSLVTTNIINAGEAQFTGVEVEGNVEPVRGLTFSFGGGYIDARYTDFVLPNGTDVTKTYVIPRVPEWNYKLGALYRADAGFATVEASVNWSWRDSQYTNITPDPLAVLPAYGLLDARLGLTRIDLGGKARLEFALWGKNLTDTKYKVSAINLSVLTLSQYGDPRTFGAEARIRF